MNTLINQQTQLRKPKTLQVENPKLVASCCQFQPHFIYNLAKPPSGGFFVYKPLEKSSIKVTKSLMNRISQNLISELEDKRFFVLDNLLSEEDIGLLYQEARRRHELKLYEPAKIGRGPNKQREESIRGDWTSWIEENETELIPIKNYLSIIDNLTKQINQVFFAGLKNFECHFSYYPEGSFYKKHVDQFQGQTARQLSCILYLNLDYQNKDGGELVIYSQDDSNEELIRINPLGGRFVCFLTKDLYHEVLICNQPRYALTGWVRND